MSGIPAAELKLLSDIPSLPDRTKVRILGCIRAYAPEYAELCLTHPPDHSTQIIVDIRVPLPTLKMGDIQDGDWYNVVGYVVVSENGRSRKVDAIRVWRADRSVDPDEWVKTVKELRRVDEAVDQRVKQFGGKGRIWDAGKD